MSKIKGIDVSSYQGAINWGKVAAGGVEFAILKVIRKDLAADKQFENNWTGATEAGIPVQGVYNYSYATTVEKAKTDAAKVLEILAGRKPMVWLDVEDDCQKNLGETLINIINEYGSVIKASGLEFGVYTGLSFYNTYLKPYAGKLQHPFWIARYPSSNTMAITDSAAEDKKPEIAHDLYGWQYSSQGSVGGITGNVDLDDLYVAVESVNMMSQPEKTAHNVGEQITVSKYYASANATAGAISKTKTGTIIKIKEGSANPYCFGVNGVATGWCNDSGIASKTTTTEQQKSQERIHTVKSGDTLSKLANKYGTTVSSIVNLNKGKYPKISANYIVVGWKLNV